jgi:hypothetical protein
MPARRSTATANARSRDAVIVSGASVVVAITTYDIAPQHQQMIH